MTADEAKRLATEHRNLEAAREALQEQQQTIATDLEVAANRICKARRIWRRTGTSCTLDPDTYGIGEAKLEAGAEFTYTNGIDTDSEGSIYLTWEQLADPAGEATKAEAERREREIAAAQAAVKRAQENLRRVTA